MSVELRNETVRTVDEHALVDVARFVLAALQVAPSVEMYLLLVSSEHMAALHEEYMGEPGPTDVMAFPIDELDLRGHQHDHGHGNGQHGGRGQHAGHGSRGPGDGDLPFMLGEIMLCPEVAERQAAEAGHSTQEELELLCVHGTLHLLGFDHGEPEEHAEMFGLQGELLAQWRAARAAG